MATRIYVSADEMGSRWSLYMWTLYPGVTDDLTHFFTARERSSFDGYVRTATDVLLDPEATVERP